MPAKSIIGDLLWFESAFNTGIAFSMFKDSVPFFIVISSISCVLFVFLIINKKIIKNKPEKICLGIVLGGAFSNLIDRVVYKGVRDFIYLKFMDFAIFNIADMAVSFGVIIFSIFFMISEFKEYKLEKVKKEQKVESSDLNLQEINDNYIKQEETMTNEDKIQDKKEENDNKLITDKLSKQEDIVEE